MSDTENDKAATTESEPAPEVTSDLSADVADIENDVAPGGQFYMAGTEGTGKYFVVLNRGRSKLGVRNYGGGFRIRLELLRDPNRPLVGVAKALTQAAGWKQPGDSEQPRFSKCASTSDEAADVLAEALSALGLHFHVNMLMAAVAAATELAYPTTPAPEPEPQDDGPAAA
jgi:hypothetical protein